MFDPHSIPADPTAVNVLAGRGFEYRQIDPADEAGLQAWVQAETRGFHHARPEAPEMRRALQVARQRNVRGVYDLSAHDAHLPVATIDGWPSGLSVPGGRSVDAWAVSGVTVSPTHRRRGIARALLEAQLRYAKEAGAALAMLTATEATIYGRFGFSPAASAATVHVDRRRAHWIGPESPGRVQFVEPADLIGKAPAIARRAVARTPGEIDRWPGMLERHLGLVDPSTRESRAVRVARYDDVAGQTQGFVAFRVVRQPDEPGAVECDLFVAASDDAERALWRFLVEQDFVTEIRVRLRSVDEPLPWLLEDPRAVSLHEVGDHLWLRIIDPVAALSAREYGASGTLTLEVGDPLRHAAGTFVLDVAGDGRAEVRPAEETTDAAAGQFRSGRRSRPQAAHGLRLDARELASIYLGGTRASVLARAGRITELAPGSLALADRLFHAPRTPHLSIWF
ncbi:GNAT family N-acetyltransferase [Agromyces salentinus]|uniref:GNAT family N-acetyltransferase n=1 Tax=Agromyces salentinus TaxID=269421 RepID=A0ABN2MFA1_9MICO|nr:GNAT family N-acetyltransferase [Agromyces salentinus]